MRMKAETTDDREVTINAGQALYVIPEGDGYSCLGFDVVIARYPKTAPSDAEAEQAYTQILRRAEQAGLIVSAYGGVATIAIPSEQRKANLRAIVLQAHGLNETTEIKS